MFNIIAPEETLQYCREVITKNSLAQRGKADGSKAEQAIGLLGQTVICDAFSIERIKGDEGFDGGYDLVIAGKKVDVKTIGRTVDPKPEYVNNIMGLQKNYSVDAYIFCSYNKKARNRITVCGMISKERFFQEATHFRQGDKRKRSDGSAMTVKEGLYEIKNSALDQADSMDDLMDLFDKRIAKYSKVLLEYMTMSPGHNQIPKIKEQIRGLK